MANIRNNPIPEHSINQSESTILAFGYTLKKKILELLKPKNISYTKVKIIIKTENLKEILHKVQPKEKSIIKYTTNDKVVLNILQ